MEQNINIIFNGTQKEMEEFIINCDKYIDVPIIKWNDFVIVYNKLDGMLQNYNGGWEDIFPYFINEEEYCPPFKTTLNDITLWLCEMHAPDDFIEQVCNLLIDFELDTYEDLDDDEIEKANKIRENYNFKFDSNRYKISDEYSSGETVMNFEPSNISWDIVNAYRAGETVMNFEPSNIETYHDDLDNTYDEHECEDNNEISDYYEEIDKILEEKHIQNCIKHKKFHVGYPRYIYLAGKIEQNGWRESIVGYRCNHLYGGDNIDLTEYTVKYNNQTIITGPWFLACDHGCYHGDNSHGLGICQSGCVEANGDNYSEKEVYDICVEQIEHSDIIFAYINDKTCYGSIYEIGYAHAIGKYVVIIFDNEKLMSDMWFMCQCAHIVDVLGNKTIKEKFDEILNKLY